jgi:hypothetical protein
MQPFILKNTLLSPSGIEKVSSMPIDAEIYPSLAELLARFQDIKKFASEIHTEIHLVKPMLKMLGYTYESKPKFFEDHVKDPDVALFASEDERTNSSKLWGTPDYYEQTLGILVLKRYGRNLHEGISGFYLEFENRIPMYQVMYLLKKARTPWGILTNGRHWILIKKPVHFEQKLIEIDLEAPSPLAEEELVRLFYNTFSLTGLKHTLPALLEKQRETLIGVLRGKKRAVMKSIGPLRTKTEVYPIIRSVYKELFPDQDLPITDEYLRKQGVLIEDRNHAKPGIINEYDGGDVASYLFATNVSTAGLDFEEIITGKNRRYTKEDLLSLRMLDMTPGFGNVTSQLLEGIAYLTFIQPYREKNSFIAEWEDEEPLKKYILDRVLYGVERSHVSFDAFQNLLSSRFGSRARHYHLGNPLIGISLKDITNMFDVARQMSLFGKNPKELIAEFREMYRVYFSLSKKIKEDVKIREEIEVKLKLYAERMKDVMDTVTATFFTKEIDTKKVEEMVFSLEANESMWKALRAKDWFVETRQLADKRGFFHMELEFPILLNGAFDFIFVQPALTYNWEDDIPVGEATKAYIKKGMNYLKQEGKMVILLDEDGHDLLLDLQKSKKYAVESKQGLFILAKKSIT